MERVHEIHTSPDGIGFETAISDGRLTAYIPLLEVLPTYRNRGVGSQLIKMMPAQLVGL
jgi:ribosomal protein S18 acetylase RimI-like enzyme